jgi:mannose-1-phosphate guanylyltransferase / mannose-6-phosphate isomerase
MKHIAVILCGGSGSRLWPLSRQLEPKQFHSFGGDASLLAQTVKRADQLAFLDEILIVSSSAHQHLLRAHVQPFTTKTTHYLLEPVARNTAAAIASAAHYIERHIASSSAACMIVMPSDHYMTDPLAFEKSIQTSIIGAQSGRLMTFGIKPTQPETGYGYIERGRALEEAGCYEVARFVEKPNLAKAQEMIANPDFAWNSGIFVFHTNTLLAEMQQFEPAIFESSKSSVDQGDTKHAFFTLDKASLETCPSKSIDYAVLEHSKKIAVVTMQADWSDLGSWGAVSDLASSKAGVDALHPVISIAANGNYVNARKAVAIVGLNDLIVIDTADALLIAHKDHSQSVKNVVDQLKNQLPGLVESHTKVQRPWGSYESLHQSAAHQLKYIEVEPGGQLSLQSHEHRAEHWVVVAGQATITVGDLRSDYTVGQHVYIEKKQKHRLENHTQEPVAIVEVQIGNYLGEDDIKRYDDVYGRV